LHYSIPVVDTDFSFILPFVRNVVSIRLVKWGVALLCIPF